MDAFTVPNILYLNYFDTLGSKNPHLKFAYEYETSQMLSLLNTSEASAAAKLYAYIRLLMIFSKTSSFQQAT